MEIHPEDHESLKALFKSYKAKHNKVYPTDKHESGKFETFKKHAKKISDHNRAYKNGTVSWYMGLNHFSDHVKYTIIYDFKFVKF